MTRKTRDGQTAETRPLRASEAAERLGVSTATIHRLINNGEINAFRVGGSVRIPAAEIDRIINTPAARQGVTK